jgi:heterodisulfide reductase subunit A
MKNLKRVVMIQCVGSREPDRPWCSRICCSHAVKNSLKLKELSPDTEVYVLYRDIRTYGTREKYYGEARDQGVRFLRYDTDRKPEVEKNGDGLRVTTFDRMLNREVKLDADMVVLSTGIIPNEDSDDQGQMLKCSLSQEKFFLEAHMKLRPVDFQTDGVFMCGLAHWPKSVDESISQACATASRAATILSQEELELEGAVSAVIDANCDGCAYCVEPCPADAITLFEYMSDGAVKKTIEVNESLCKGCGSCQATCPKKGVEIKHFKLEQIEAMINAALER